MFRDPRGGRVDLRRVDEGAAQGTAITGEEGGKGTPRRYPRETLRPKSRRGYTVVSEGVDVPPYPETLSGVEDGRDP